MLLNYLKLSLRLMARNPFYTFIKVAGLAVGLAIFLILWQYSENESKSDQQWNDSENTYRLGMVAKWTDDKTNWQQSSFATNIVLLTESIIPKYPEITEVTRIMSRQALEANDSAHAYVTDHGADLFLSAGSGTEKKSFRENEIVYADPNVLTFFGIPLIDGHAETALQPASSIVLSEKLSIKYFGTTNSIGNIISINDHIALTVTGIFRDLPHNTHFTFDALISSVRLGNRYHTLPGNIYSPVHYIKVRSGTDVDDLIGRINKNEHKTIANAVFGDWPYGDGELYIQALREVPFQNFILDSYLARSKFSLNVFRYVAIAILLLAWINYINLTGADNLKRNKEVATRKVIGASRLELLFQFMIEATVIICIAFLLALTLVQLVKLPIESVFGLYILPWFDILRLSFWILATLFACGGVISGLYLAWASARQSRNGLFSPVTKNSGIRTAVFTSFQYSIAIVIVVFAFVSQGQLNFIQNADIGFRKEEIVVVDLPLTPIPNVNARVASFMEKIRSMNAAISYCVPGDDKNGLINLIQPGIGAGLAVVTNGGVDENFIPLYGIRMLQGRNFLQNNPADSGTVLVSAITAERLGFKSAADAVGRKVIAGVNPTQEAIIAGVFEDYNLRPLLNTGYYESKGLAMTYKDFLLPGLAGSQPKKVSFRIAASDLDASLSKIEAAYRDTFSDPLFNWYFLDETINSKYRQHIKMGNQLNLFSIVAIGLACMGLLGMMIFKINNKIKEIGIRKILGARLLQIATVLLDSMMKQVILATIVGVPVAYLLVNRYLENFSEKIGLQWWHFTIPVAMLLILMLSTIASVVLNAAKSNPVEALKNN